MKKMSISNQEQNNEEKEIPPKTSPNSEYAMKMHHQGPPVLIFFHQDQNARQNYYEINKLIRKRIF